MNIKKTIIAEQVRDHIISGKLAEGGQVFGRDYSAGANHGTVMEALKILEGEELLDRRPGLGYVVAAGAQAKAHLRMLEMIQKWVPSMVARAKAVGLDEKEFMAMIRSAYKN